MGENLPITGDQDDRSACAESAVSRMAFRTFPYLPNPRRLSDGVESQVKALLYKAGESLQSELRSVAFEQLGSHGCVFSGGRPAVPL
jgi:hypothetical protein